MENLTLAGVQCAGNPHFCVNEDGSYQEEGQKNTKGYIWGKAGMKLVCTFLTLPVPSKSSNVSGEQFSSMTSRTVPDYTGILLRIEVFSTLNLRTCGSEMI
ncbi:extra-large guanine nucleotide-binding protein 1-like [Euphorbia lathyris]|uniref:extra-large guanine nucleotide-binding protein 1-like n=1 Tax=Euphorbia lathyris TaxID=212925 RepID=UPI0033138FED